MGNAEACGTCGEQVVAAVVIMRQNRFSETPVRKQAEVLGPGQDQVWPTGCRGSGGGVLGLGLTPATFRSARRIEQGNDIEQPFTNTLLLQSPEQ